MFRRSDYDVDCRRAKRSRTLEEQNRFDYDVYCYRRLAEPRLNFQDWVWEEQELLTEQLDPSHCWLELRAEALRGRAFGASQIALAVSRTNIADAPQHNVYLANAPHQLVDCPCLPPTQAPQELACIIEKR